MRHGAEDDADVEDLVRRAPNIILDGMPPLGVMDLRRGVQGRMQSDHGAIRIEGRNINRENGLVR